MNNLSNRFKILMIVCTLFILNSFCFHNKSNNIFPHLKGKYFGQESPGLSLKPFIPEIFSVDGIFKFHLHSSIFFTPDGKEVYFTNQDTSTYRNTIYFMEQIDGVWKNPEIVPFSGSNNDEILWLSPNGRRLYFSSNRSTIKNKINEEEEGLWVVEKSEDGWSEPVRITTPSDLKWNDGTIYVSANLGNGIGGNDIYKLKYQGKNYSYPQNVGHIINTPWDDYVQCLPKDESFIIYYHFNPTENNKRGLYISFHKNDDSWSEPIYLKTIFNLSLDFRATLSPSEEFLFILNRKDGIYWIDTQKIKNMNLFINQNDNKTFP